MTEETEKPQRTETPSSITKPETKDNGAKGSDSDTENGDSGEILDFSQMPPEERRIFQSFMGMFTRYIGPRPNPLFEKFTDAHIDKYLDYIQRDDDNAHELRKSNRWFYLGYAVIALVAFGAGVVYLLPKDRDLLLQLVVILVTLAGGIGAGYGLSKREK